jgi:hypothetical protein
MALQFLHFLATMTPLASAFARYEMATPQLLAEQPPTAPERLAEFDPDWETMFSHLESTLAALKDWRYSWWTYWSKLAEYLLPRRYRWLVTANLMRKGNAINQAIIDSTAGLAKNICYTGMVEGLIPTTRVWFKTGIMMPGIELNADEKAWLEAVDRVLYLVLAKSNFYTEMAQMAEDEVVFGTGVVFLQEDARNVICCSVPCAGEYSLAVGAQNTADTCYTEETKTVKQLVDMLGLKGCPPVVQRLWEEGGASLQNEFVLARAVEPNFALDGRGRARGTRVQPVPMSFAYREIYWLRGQNTGRPLSARGYHEKPFAAFRWAKTGNDPYGRGPGMEVLGDTIQLQIMTRRLNEAIEKQVRPAMGADPTMKNEPASINPAQITYVNTENGRKGFWSLFDVKLELAGMVATMEKICTRIDRGFYNHVFMAISQMQGVQPRQNLEIQERKNEAMQQLGPVIGLWKQEMHEVLSRCFDIASRKKLIPTRPQRLRKMALKFDFLDMVTLAQLGAKTAEMDQGFEQAGKLSLAAKAATLPDPMRCVNLDDALRAYLEACQFPPTLVYDQQEVHEHDQARAHAAQAKQLMAVAPAAQPAVDAAKGLASIPPDGGNSLLGQILGGGKAPQGGQPAAPGQ